MTMTSIFPVLLGLHIAAGMTAFVLAPVALLTVKGGKAHRQCGKVYFWMMSIVAATALVMASYKHIHFLTLVAIFSFYSALGGYRVLYRKRPLQGEGPRFLDWFAAALTFIASALLTAFGAFRPSTVQNMGIVSIVFGLIGMFIAGSDIVEFLRPPIDKNFWWYGHMGGMIGSYIAALTAFSAVTLSRFFGTSPVVWLWPTAIGLPGLFIWIGYYRRRFNRKRKTLVPDMAATT